MRVSLLINSDEKAILMTEYWYIIESDLGFEFYVSPPYHEKPFLKKVCDSLIQAFKLGLDIEKKFIV